MAHKPPGLARTRAAKKKDVSPLEFTHWPESVFSWDDWEFDLSWDWKDLDLSFDEKDLSWDWME